MRRSRSFKTTLGKRLRAGSSVRRPSMGKIYKFIGRSRFSRRGPYPFRYW